MEIMKTLARAAELFEGLGSASSIASWLKLKSFGRKDPQTAVADRGGASGEKKIAADALNLTLDDENLFLGAIALAKNLGLITNEDEIKFIKPIFALLEPDEAKRLRHIIGREESECVVRIPDGKGGFTDTKTAEISRGALILQSFVGVPPRKTVEMLRKSKTLTSAWDEVVELWGVTQKKLEDLEFQRGVLNFIGYESLEALEQSNADKAHALRTRKSQFWMEWLWPSSGFGFVIFTAVGGITGFLLLFSFFSHTPK